MNKVSSILFVISLLIVYIFASSCKVEGTRVTTSPALTVVPTEVVDEGTKGIASPEIRLTPHENQLVPSPSPVNSLEWIGQLPFKIIEANCKVEDLVPLDNIPEGRLWFEGVKEDQAGIYYLDSNELEPALVITEDRRVAKGIVTKDAQWIVYSIQCDPGKNCPIEYRSDYLAAWVIVSGDGSIMNRLPFVGEANPFQWKLLSSSADGVELLISPGGYWLYDGLQDFSILQVPTGQERPFPYHSELPDLYPYGGIHFSIGVAIDPTLTLGFYYAQGDPDKLVLRNLENDITLWEVDDLTDVLDSGLGTPWEWSPNGKFIAFTFSTDNVNSYDRPQGDVFILDRSGSIFLRVTDFSEIFDGRYISLAGPWSPDGDKLAVSVQEEDRIRSFIIDFLSHSTFEICHDYYIWSGIWSPDSEYLATYYNHKVFVFDIRSGKYGSITVFDEIRPLLFSWLP